MAKTLIQIKKDNGWNPKNKKSENLSRMITAYCSNVNKYFEDYVLCELDEKIPAWVAGGALRDYFLYGYVKSGTDIDIFTNCEENFEKLRENLKEFYDEKYESDLALSFFDKDDNEKMVQLIKIFTDTPEECIGRFDFTCCCAYVGRMPEEDRPSGTTVGSKQVFSDAADEFFEDCYHKKLRLLRLNENPTITLQRVKNYVKNKGFEISDFEAKSIVTGYIRGNYQLEELVHEYEGLRLA